MRRNELKLAFAFAATLALTAVPAHAQTSVTEGTTEDGTIEANYNYNGESVRVAIEFSQPVENLSITALAFLDFFFQSDLDETGGTLVEVIGGANAGGPLQNYTFSFNLPSGDTFVGEDPFGGGMGVGEVSFGYNSGPIEIFFDASGPVSYRVVVTSIAGAVPEPATWALLILGFGAIGAAMRMTKRSHEVRVSYR